MHARGFVIRAVLVVAAVALAMGGLACGTDQGDRGRTASRPARRDEARHTPAAAPIASASAAADEALAESAFVPSDDNRDPFAPWRAPVVAPPPIDPRDNLFADSSLAELRLVAIVSGEGGAPRAMIEASDGFGRVVERGDRVGRPEIERRGPGGAPVALSWRVERIRPDRIILVRDGGAEGQPQTRVIELHPDDQVAHADTIRKLDSQG
jgi:hypothetical protein